MAFIGSLANTNILGTITGSQLGSGAAVTNIGYTPDISQRSAALYSTATGSPWLRIGYLQGRYPYRVTVGTTGGWYGPGSTTFNVFRSWSNDVYVSGAIKLGGQYCTQVRCNSPTQDQDWYIEVLFNGIHSSSGNGTSLWDAFSFVIIEPLGPTSSVNAIYSGTLATNPSSAGYVSAGVVI